ncbi:radical SAM protein [Desulfocurvus vexinensis]|uniref:radical SAM protein n=1 Tax=Desulfocurvus vexinensis TaxID=399548 RepID=UPI0004B0CB4C|nr:radical SAM protein [Desulfocurvus vexinensis]
MPAERFHCLTLGCRINQYETQALREAWAALGLTETGDPGRAGVILVNSCAVTAKAVAGLRAALRRLARQSPGARLVLTGCAAQAHGAELARAFPGLAVVPQARKAELLAGPPGPPGAPALTAPSPGTSLPATTRAAATAPGAFGTPVPAPAPPGARPPDPAGAAPAAAPAAPAPGDAAPGLLAAPAAPRAFPPFAVRGSARARAAVMVQDGCSQGCAYCIVPLTRGGPVSREPGAVIAEVDALFAAGWREAVLSGVNLRQYGLGQGRDFWDLLAAVDAALAPRWAGRARLRLSSLDPAQLGPRALDVLGAARLVCPHLHLSLQSLAPAVLRRMGRGHYGPEGVADAVAGLGSIWPVFGLGADILTGFPGETEDEFRQTLAGCAKLPLSYAHVFPYSPRPGTAAARLPRQLPGPEKTARATALRAVACAASEAFARRAAALPGVDVVLEYGDPRRGVSEHFTPCRLTGPAPGAAPRDLVRARPVAARGAELDVDQA